MIGVSPGRMKAIFAAAIAAAVVGAFGAWITDLGPWYYSLREPAWKPPDWLFGPAWTFIYACAALAGVLAWKNANTARARLWILALFAINVNLNILWSGLFFRLHRPDYALVEVVFLWLSIVALIIVLRRFSTTAGWLLAPYLAWVTFAAALNFEIVNLNAPFPGY